MKKYMLIIVWLVTGGSVCASAELKYPEIKAGIPNVAGSEKVDFKIFNRLKLQIHNNLPESVSKFTKNLIVSRFFSNPCAYGDRFCDIKFPDGIKDVEFVIVYEPIASNQPACLGAWWYFLRVNPAPRGKSAAVAQYLISNKGEILYGEGISPYSWSERDCPIAN
jgi:hypothetical protein